jgi:hypothetical protein
MTLTNWSERFAKSGEEIAVKKNSPYYNDCEENRTFAALSGLTKQA